MIEKYVFVKKHFYHSNELSLLNYVRGFGYE